MISILITRWCGREADVMTVRWTGRAAVEAMSALMSFENRLNQEICRKEHGRPSRDRRQRTFIFLPWANNLHLWKRTIRSSSFHSTRQSRDKVKDTVNLGDGQDIFRSAKQIRKSDVSKERRQQAWEESNGGNLRAKPGWEKRKRDWSTSFYYALSQPDQKAERCKLKPEGQTKRQSASGFHLFGNGPRTCNLFLDAVGNRIMECQIRPKVGRSLSQRINPSGNAYTVFELRRKTRGSSVRFRAF